MSTAAAPLVLGVEELNVVALAAEEAAGCHLQRRRRREERHFSSRGVTVCLSITGLQGRRRSWRDVFFHLVYHNSGTRSKIWRKNGSLLHLLPLCLHLLGRCIHLEAVSKLLLSFHSPFALASWACSLHKPLHLLHPLTLEDTLSVLVVFGARARADFAVDMPQRIMSCGSPS